MQEFESSTVYQGDGIPASIKVRVTGGCFHREHSPEAFSLIDEAMQEIRVSETPTELIEHETGPEILVYLAVTTAGLSLAKSVVDLITAILKARQAGISQGDRPDQPLEVIVRLIDDSDTYRESQIIELDKDDQVDSETIQRILNEELEQLPEHE
jgi:hypothetical protein